MNRVIISPIPDGHRLSTEIIISRPIEEVFSFFSKAENLQVLTPSFLAFEILSEAPIEMNTGTLIDYRIKLNGLPMKWTTHIKLWSPPFRFVDEQLKGPYLRWEHEHRFETIDSNHTRMFDTVEYRVFGGQLIHKLFVEKKLRKIFSYRLDKLKSVFPD